MHLVGDGVVAKFVGEGLAARESLHAEPDTARDAEALDGFIGVLRTRGMKAAISSEKDGQVGFVKAHREECGFHRQCARGDCFARGIWRRRGHGVCNNRSRSAVSVECCARAAMLFG